MRRFTIITAGFILLILFSAAVYFSLPYLLGSVIYGIPSEYEAPLLAVAKEHNLNPCLLAGVFHHESGWNPRAGSHAGARGLGQVMPGTWTSVNRLSGYGYPLSAIFNPYENMRVSGWLMDYNLKRYGSLRNSLIAYNAGGGRAHLPDNQLPRETFNYIRIVPATIAGYVRAYPQLCQGDIVRGTSGIPSNTGFTPPQTRAAPPPRERFQEFSAETLQEPEQNSDAVLRDLWRFFLPEL